MEQLTINRCAFIIRHAGCVYTLQQTGADIRGRCVRDWEQGLYFPTYTMAAGQECRVYTNEVHSEWCGFSFGSPSALWSNSGDCGYLYDDGSLVSTRCYP
jgi:hypothetical protein